MAELTQTELETKIAAIDTQIATLYASPMLTVNHAVGQKRFDMADQVTNLLKMREVYQKLLDTFPAEDFQRYAIDTDKFGEDQTEYLGDSGE